jgi:hypothetical protein
VGADPSRRIRPRALGTPIRRHRSPALGSRAAPGNRPVVEVQREWPDPPATIPEPAAKDESKGTACWHSPTCGPRPSAAQEFDCGFFSALAVVAQEPRNPLWRQPVRVHPGIGLLSISGPRRRTPTVRTPDPGVSAPGEHMPAPFWPTRAQAREATIRARVGAPEPQPRPLHQTNRVAVLI